MMNKKNIKILAFALLWVASAAGFGWLLSFVRLLWLQIALALPLCWLYFALMVGFAEWVDSHSAGGPVQHEQPGGDP